MAEQICNADLAYAAGIIDGEGCIHIIKRKDRRTFSGTITVAMCEPQAIKLLHNLFGGSLDTLRRPKRPNARPQYGWGVAAQQAAEVCRKILPYLRVKKRQAENLIELQEINANIRDHTTIQRRYRRGQLKYGRFSIDPALLARTEALYEDQRQLNQRGLHDDDIPMTKRTPPPINRSGSMLFEENMEEIADVIEDVAAVASGTTQGS